MEFGKRNQKLFQQKIKKIKMYIMMVRKIDFYSYVLMWSNGIPYIIYIVHKSAHHFQNKSCRFPPFPYKRYSKGQMPN